MATQWPLLAARLVSLLPTLSGWSAVEVFDGPPVTGDVPGDYCTVGYVEDDTAGTYTDDLGDFGNAFSTENGLVRCQLVCGTGDVDLPSMRSRAFGYLDTLRAALRSDPTAGVLPAGSTTALTVDVLSSQNQAGSAQALVFSITYQCPVVS